MKAQAFREFESRPFRQNMLFPGHIASGYLVAKFLLKIQPTDLSPNEINSLLAWGAFWGFAPDLDLIFPFIKLRTWKLNTKISHRRVWTHAPLVWLLAGLGVYFFGPTPYVKYFGLIIWLASWSHFLGDSIEYGIMWLWPFSKKQFAFHKVPDEDRFLDLPAKSFYWSLFKEEYLKNYTFYIECGIIIIAISVYLISS